MVIGARCWKYTAVSEWIHISTKAFLMLEGWKHLILMGERKPSRFETRPLPLNWVSTLWKIRCLARSKTFTDLDQAWPCARQHILRLTTVRCRYYLSIWEGSGTSTCKHSLRLDKEGTILGLGGVIRGLLLDINVYIMYPPSCSIYSCKRMLMLY